MFDFLKIIVEKKKNIVEISPDYDVHKSSDLMTRGGDFYAIWLDDLQRWSTDEQDAIDRIDMELDKFANENREKLEKDGEFKIRVLHLRSSRTRKIAGWHQYCQKDLRDHFHQLDETLVFSNTKPSKKDYSSKSLPYPLEEGECPAWDRMMEVLYSEEERHKIEWCIGSIVSGDSKILQKFAVFYGAAGTGKSTVLNVIESLFKGYTAVFDAKALGSSNESFSLEPFKTNPLVAIQHDGDLSRIEDNTRLNSLVSHELMPVNEKFKSVYPNRFKCFLFMGTNKPVKITDSRSGIIRRLIDISPSGNTLPTKEYKAAVKQVEFELGAIAYKCKQIYLDDPEYYDDYIPTLMLGASNDFYNYIADVYYDFKSANGVSLGTAWAKYKEYCKDTNVLHPMTQRIFREELKVYFKEYYERYKLEDGTRVRSYYYGFKTDRFDSDNKEKPKSNIYKIDFNSTKSLLDIEYANCKAQYANREGTPSFKWDDVSTTLSELNTKRVHYVMPPENHIVIDFDIPDEEGNKDFEKNLIEASKWPPTYSELSKSGAGIHLHYIYKGDVSKLSSIFDDHIEIKTFPGNSSLRRKLSKCNDIPIATISSGLPLKGDKKVIDKEVVQTEKGIRTLIKRNLNKEYHANTKPSIDFIFKILEDAYSNKDLHYDVSDMKNAVIAFANGSTNNAEYCLNLVTKMHFKSEDRIDTSPEVDISSLMFYDVEVFPNLFLINCKLAGDNPMIRMFNPTSAQIENLIKHPLVGFNCRRYDNHILYARLMGYTNEQLYRLSQRIISGESNCFFSEAYNLSYTDIYDFSSVKQSLKKFEIDLGIHHQELGLPWDQPVPEGMWEEVARYCDNDVIATEAVFNSRQADFTARKILADVAGMSVNDTTNSLTTRIIFGDNRKPQSEFNYRDMGDDRGYLKELDDDEYTKFTVDGKPIFPGYVYDHGKSTYRGEEVGEGGYVYAEPGMYTNVALLDIASMHPSSIVAENLFGKEYTQRFKDILDARIAIKHKDFSKARKMLGGKLSKYLTDENTAKDLAQALKIAINSVYGLTAAKFDNPFRDIRNKDNIVAKRGALFMINLKHKVQEQGFTVAHIKTDSIKIPNATPEIISFVQEYGAKYGYTFEHEATYDRMCLVNDAVYIAKYDNGEWTATGTQFQVPYVFKTLFSKDPIMFDDMCETKSVTSALYLDMNEGLGTDEHDYKFVGKIGRFCPIKPGCGGGELLRDNGKGGYSAATGTKGYRWLESEQVAKENRADDIDKSYYQKLVDQAVKDISKYGDIEQFIGE